MHIEAIWDKTSRNVNFAHKKQNTNDINIFILNISLALFPGQNRFKQSEVRTTPYNVEGEAPLDATKTGPLCQQVILDQFKGFQKNKYRVF